MVSHTVILPPMVSAPRSDHGDLCIHIESMCPQPGRCKHAKSSLTTAYTQVWESTALPADPPPPLTDFFLFQTASTTSPTSTSRSSRSSSRSRSLSPDPALDVSRRSCRRRSTPCAQKTPKRRTAVEVRMFPALKINLMAGWSRNISRLLSAVKRTWVRIPDFETKFTSFSHGHY